MNDLFIIIRFLPSLAMDALWESMIAYVEAKSRLSSIEGRAKISVEKGKTLLVYKSKNKLGEDGKRRVLNQVEKLKLLVEELDEAENSKHEKADKVITSAIAMLAGLITAIGVFVALLK